MTKSILLALLTVTGSAVSTEQAFACGRGSGCAIVNSPMAPSCAAPASGSVPAATTAPAVPAAADPHAGMNMTQANKSGAYQSFSYEPGSSQPAFAAPVRTYRTPAPVMRQPSNTFYDSVRGDRKVRGFMN